MPLTSNQQLIHDNYKNFIAEPRGEVDRAQVAALMCIAEAMNGLKASSNALSIMRSSVLTMTASSTTSLGLVVPYAISQKLIIEYSLPITTSAGPGVNFKVAALPTGATAHMAVCGPTGVIGTPVIVTTTTITTATTNNFLSVFGTGTIKVSIGISGGTAAGSIDLQMVTGVSQAGSVRAAASVTYYTAT